MRFAIFSVLDAGRNLFRKETALENFLRIKDLRIKDKIQYCAMCGLCTSTHGPDQAIPSGAMMQGVPTEEIIAYWRLKRGW